jgi:hypothetical protein
LAIGVRLPRYQVCFPSKVFNGKSGDTIPINNALFGIMFPDYEGIQVIQGIQGTIQNLRQVLIDRVGFTEKRGSDSRKPGTRGGA